VAKGVYERLDDNVGPEGSGHASRGAVVVIGNFDGVHRGHAAVLTAAVERARREQLAAYVLTFDPHPRTVVAALSARSIAVPKSTALLTTMERRAELMTRLGIDRVFVRTFNDAFAAWPPERFVEELLVGQLSAKVVMIGENFHFGSMAAGDFATMTSLGLRFGFETVPHPLVGDDGGTYSSSRARIAIGSGDMAAAEHVLGRPHAVSGVVVHGKKLGRTLGFPTANLADVPETLPPDGIYAALVDRVEPGGAVALGWGSVSIGVRPTVGEGLARMVEIYLLDFEGDLYDRTLRVHLVSRIRGEEKFADLDALKVQIARDVDETRRRLQGRIPGASGAFG
jgi:riboflavin kinase/FMN adenylyltransferase